MAARTANSLLLTLSLSGSRSRALSRMCVCARASCSLSVSLPLFCHSLTYSLAFTSPFLDSRLATRTLCSNSNAKFRLSPARLAKARRDSAIKIDHGMAGVIIIVSRMRGHRAPAGPPCTGNHGASAVAAVLRLWAGCPGVKRAAPPYLCAGGLLQTDPPGRK